ncbi:MAG: hypothetical protein M3Z13_07905 [Candidatus Dormibacteraeota bacterium]|nr:hypothetical protein [Candidatus Dormibacteraeota bacterium]
MSWKGRPVGVPRREARDLTSIRRCSLRSRRAAGAFGREHEFEPAERRGRPTHARL